LGEITGYLKAHGEEAMKPYVVPLATALGHLQQATQWLAGNGTTKPDHAGAAATDYLHLMGLVALGYMWCRIVQVAQTKLAADQTAERMGAKLVTGRFFFDRMLPETAAHLARIQSGSASVMALAADEF
jgi:acyl-CoA dehydrogenase